MVALAERTVYVLDDDLGARESLRWLIESVGHRVETFSRPTEFFEAYDPTTPSCLVLDMRMPEMSGQEVLQRLRSSGSKMPVIVITAFGDVPSAVQAMKGGAVDYLEKPFPSLPEFNDHVLLSRIEQCHEEDDRIRRENELQEEIRANYETLTPRERQVMDAFGSPLLFCGFVEQLD